ncbi:hypothetical protein G6F56_013429 [Rhizopus delemar]|nr:hypothetical protein G6F56_013429 [Rhizopus delemar]
MTFRLNCPFSVYGRFNAKQKKFVVKTVVSEHNHHLANDPRTYSTNRKLNPSHFEFAVQLLKTNTPAKTLEILGALGVENVLKKDLENMQQQFKSNDDMASFVFDLQNKNYDELRRLPECIVVDATYKTNIHKMVLLNFVVASTVSSREKPHQLATIPVAAAWMDRETADNYSWVLQQLRDITMMQA